jgi:hypothetical protein
MTVLSVTLDPVISSPKRRILLTIESLCMTN